ncbi:peptidoglycan-recognition protein SC2-like [Lampetra fluviatilis]
MKFLLLLALLPFIDACPRIVSRSGWGARSPNGITSMPVPVYYFIIHHTATPTCSDEAACSARVRSIQNYHMDSNGWSDIGYSFLVGGDGNVYEGRGWDRQGAHTSGYNTHLAASFIGDFTSSKPVASAITAAKALITCAINKGKLKSSYRLIGHRQVGSTTCPGDALYNEIKTWTNWGNP